MASTAGNSAAGGKSASSAASKSKSETVNYLLLYEAMVRHQDLEFDATHDHLALAVGRIQHLGRKGPFRSNNSTAGIVKEEDSPAGMLTYLQMRRCLLRLGYAWNRSLLPSSGGKSVASASSAGTSGQPRYYHDYDDDVSVMSGTSGTTFQSGGAVSDASGGMGGARDIIATDAQLIMLLTTLVEAEERSRAARMAAAEEDDDEEEKGGEDGTFGRGLYLPEFVQAYKLIIGGMQSLQAFPEGNDPALQDLRIQSRERTLGLLRLFGPDARLFKDDPYAKVTPRQSAGEDSATGKRGKKKKTVRDGLRQTSNRTMKGRGAMRAKDGLSPRLTDEEIRTMVHSKDAALARVLEEHETEMNAMANDMEELRAKGVRTQQILRTRRRRTRIAAVVGFLILAVGGGYYEYVKREQVRSEIETGKEEVRKADAAKIKSLEDEVAALRAKLNDAEATIRYEEGRYAAVVEKHDRASKTLEDSERRWKSEGRELERCRVTRKELDAELSAVRTRNEEVEEEVSWCRERLEGAERAMEGMERALKKSKGSKGEEGGEVPSFIELAKEAEAVAVAREGAEAGAEGNEKRVSKHKPVKMEMKYNKSFRNAVILRQVYSAAAGMALSALFPMGKIIGLFLK